MMSLKSIWASLHNPSGSAGWQTLGIHPESSCVIRAGVRYPEKREGLLIEVPASIIPRGVEYPEARGFEVFPERLTPGVEGLVRISLMRSGDGNPDLFSIVAEDISRRVAGASDLGEAISMFFARINSWQAFMLASGGQRLSENEEVGLMGELFFLEQVLFKRMDVVAALKAWQGPLRGLRDFLHQDRGIEIKATTSPSKSSVRITSLDQLDEKSLISLHLVLAKLIPGETGYTLPELIDCIRERIDVHGPGAKLLLDERLLQMGYLDTHREDYQRRLAPLTFEAYRVTDCFPRLTRECVPAGIQGATYDVDLSLAKKCQVDMISLLNQFLEVGGGA